MFIDDFLDDNPNFSMWNGKYLRDAVVFKAPDNLWISEKDNMTISDYLNYVDVQDSDGNPVLFYNMQLLHKTHFYDSYLFKLPYKNIAMVGNIGPYHQGIYWVIDAGIKYIDSPHSYYYDVCFILKKDNHAIATYWSFCQDTFSLEIPLLSILNLNLKGEVYPISDRMEYSGLLALCAYLIRLVNIINCKNIETILIKPNASINLKRKKRGKKPLISYYTLSIKQSSNKICSTSKNIWSNRIHLCRGHFKHYGENNPLFGKHKGMWWWEPSLRGRDRQGIVVKDYQIGPGEQAPDRPQNEESESNNKK